MTYSEDEFSPISKKQEYVMKLLSGNELRTIEWISKVTKIPESEVIEIINDLMAKGYIAMKEVSIDIDN